MVDHDPFRIWVGNDLVSNDAWPSGRIDDEKVCLAVFDALCSDIIGFTQTAPTFIFFGGQNGMWMNWNDIRANQFSVTHSLTSLWFRAGHSTIALPVPMIVP